MSDSNPTIIVRRRWDDTESARVALQHARELAIKNQPGGICGPIPRPFLFARVWCDHLIEGADIHACDPRSAPHELELCVLERDNPDVYAALRARATLNTIAKVSASSSLMDALSNDCSSDAFVIPPIWA
jgi:hypothetical protein